MQRWIKLALLCWALCGLTYAQANEHAPLRIGLTAVFLEEQTALIHSWQLYLESRLNRRVSFVQRASYREIIVLLKNGKLDFAWLCGYPYITNKKFLRLLAVPVYHGKPTYQSYLIVPADDRKTRSIVDLKGKLFAFSDPDSNSGYLVPVYELNKLNKKPDTFFGKTFFTWAHSKVIEAVASGVAQGGAVDGYIWDSQAIRHPELTSQTRIVNKSPEFGFPPIVSRRSMATTEVNTLRAVLLFMQRDEEGRKLLEKMNLDGFVSGNDKMFETIAAMALKVAN
ncbi:MAG: phosphate/phosphite/phosphonate ABC transporter substrate-binding protein [Gallionella sp.]